MDGFAVRASDTAGATEAAPAALTRGRRVARRRAVRRSRSSAGQAVRISTGAMVPAGSDAVLRVEDARRGRRNGQHEPRPWRPAARSDAPAEDIRAGDGRARRRHPLGPAELGVAASTGAAQVPCARRPRGGDRRHRATSWWSRGRRCAPERSATRTATRSRRRSRRRRATVVSVETVRRRLRRTRWTALRRALAADVVVTTGGVSVGAHDHVKPALAELGVEEVFWGVALRPGHPTWFGTRRRRRYSSSACRATRCPRWSPSTCSCGRRSRAMLGDRAGAPGARP